ncbi:MULTISPECIES: MATE family efflux transporter [Limosilactobacillus]|uniref:MATE family efflux transporter n=1 Tax=Limosilactobacillus pontis TaxID=35787 RepID=A0ABU7STL4_9LACO|nr:MATE family efflux transporter [Limosilactobacillus pontis]MCX2186741.1 MATE family efflux transporter [Limosilactobacillus pontis]MCX2188413.1 MATE family efflux transporter [Limosilactobacillus pontis]HJE27279.1 MATE family efflux transporter [Limosilactobacillus pontis]
MNSTQAIQGEVRHYVVRNVVATLGMSLYVLIDTLFISIAAGALGLTTLNLVLPLFNVFNGVGLLLGVGGATIFSLNKVLHPERIRDLYSQLIIFAATLGIVLAVLLNVFATPVVNFLGANDQTRRMAIIYLRICAWSGPLYMCNYISINFIRNDGNPTLTMKATLTETLSVIVIDWFFIFGCGLKMEGAALAVLFSPLISLIVLSRHRHFAGRQLQLHWARPQLANLGRSAKLGVAAALNELSTGVSIYFFNHVLLQLADNYAVAAYGVISNIAIVVLAIANGVALGVQPIASREYGQHHFTNVTTALKMGTLITLLLATISFVILVTFKLPIIEAFNTAHSAQLVSYARVGLPIYFTSTFFSALNLLFILFLTAINAARASFTLSILRGYVILLPAILILAALVGINGVWSAVPVTEFLVCIIASLLVRQRIKQFNA